MEDYQLRTSVLLGVEAMGRLAGASVAVVGLGGVGGACAEALARCGIGRLILLDSDSVDPTNLNRQLFATVDTVGKPKTVAAEERLHAIVPSLRLVLLSEFYNEENKEELFSHSPDIIVDAIDTVSSKLSLAAECQRREIPIICSLGTGNRLDPTAFRLGTIEDTAGCGCPLARVMRRECRTRGITRLPVLYSTELPRTVALAGDNGRHPPASISFCPPAAGYAIASWVVKRLLSGDESTKPGNRTPKAPSIRTAP